MKGIAGQEMQAASQSCEWPLAENKETEDSDLQACGTDFCQQHDKPISRLSLRAANKECCPADALIVVLWDGFGQVCSSIEL